MERGDGISRMVVVVIIVVVGAPRMWGEGYPPKLGFGEVFDQFFTMGTNMGLYGLKLS